MIRIFQIIIFYYPLVIPSIIIMELGLNIDPENIRGSVKIIAALTCPICSLLLRSPVMRCEECGNYFCQSCLGDWWSKEGEAGKCIYKCNTSMDRVNQMN